LRRRATGQYGNEQSESHLEQEQNNAGRGITQSTEHRAGTKNHNGEASFRF
jgi:hypothetical protein